MTTVALSSRQKHKRRLKYIRIIYLRKTGRGRCQQGGKGGNNENNQLGRFADEGVLFVRKGQSAKRTNYCRTREPEIYTNNGGTVGGVSNAMSPPWVALSVCEKEHTDEAHELCSEEVRERERLSSRRISGTGDRGERLRIPKEGEMDDR